MVNSEWMSILVRMRWLTMPAFKAHTIAYRFGYDDTCPYWAKHQIKSINKRHGRTNSLPLLTSIVLAYNQATSSFIWIHQHSARQRPSDDQDYVDLFSSKITYCVLSLLMMLVILDSWLCDWQRLDNFNYDTSKAHGNTMRTPNLGMVVMYQSPNENKQSSLLYSLTLMY